MKIAILGYSGSGKSTLAKHLSNVYHLPLMHLDQVKFVSNWQVREQTEAKQLVREYLVQDSWIIEGNYSDFYQKERLSDATQIILLEFSRWTCLKRIIKRYLTYKNTTRPDMAANCPEKIDGEFLWWILYKGRTKKKRLANKRIVENYPKKTVVLRNQKELTNFYQSIQKNKGS
jgi:adenylate kinase family enzyme